MDCTNNFRCVLESEILEIPEVLVLYQYIIPTQKKNILKSWHVFMYHFSLLVTNLNI
jgi:hypothetical protein